MARSNGNTPYEIADEVIGLLQDIRSEIRESQGRDDIPVTSVVQRPARTTADGAGISVVDLGGPSAGSRWEIESVTFNAGAPNAVLRLFLDEVDGLNCIAQVVANAITSTGAMAGIELTVPENRKVIAHISNGTAGAPAVVRMQARQVATPAAKEAKKIAQLL